MTTAVQLQDKTESGVDVFLVTKSDTVDDPNGPFRGIMIGGVGIVKITTRASNDISIPSGVLAAGVIHPIYVRRVWNSTTTATDIYGVK